MSKEEFRSNFWKFLSGNIFRNFPRTIDSVIACDSPIIHIIVTNSFNQSHDKNLYFQILAFTMHGEKFGDMILNLTCKYALFHYNNIFIWGVTTLDPWCEWITGLKWCETPSISKGSEVVDCTSLEIHFDEFDDFLNQLYDYVINEVIKNG